MRSRRRGLFVPTVFISVLGLVVSGVPLPAMAASHVEAPLIAQSRDVDIKSIYAFAGSDPSNTVLAMTVSPGAGLFGPTNFGDKTILNLNIDHDGDLVTDVGFTAFFGPAGPDGTQDTILFRSDGTGTTEVANGLTNATLPVAGGGSFLAGLRSDPLFLDLGGLLGTLGEVDNDRALNDGMGSDFFDQNTLALVLEVPDDSLLDSAGPSINVWASSYRLDGLDLVRADRKGNPFFNLLINSPGPLIGADPTARDIYKLGSPETDGAWRPNMESLLARLSAADTEGPYDAFQLDTMSAMYLPDTLRFDTSTSAAFPNGRALDDDVFDMIINTFSGGEPFPGRDDVGWIAGDGVGSDSDYLGAFPYLAPPSMTPPPPKPATVGVHDGDTGSWYLVDPILADLAAHEVPGPGDPGGSGTTQLTFNADTGRVCFDHTFGGLSGAVTGAHLHAGGPGINGPVVIDLEWGTQGAAGCVESGQALIDQILADLDAFYVNIHTSMHPAGAIRGQLGGGPLPPFFFGDPADDPFLGDWDGDGTSTPGLYRPDDATVYLRNSNTTGFADIEFLFGDPGDIPLIGDWDGDGDDTVSLYRPSESRVFITNWLQADGTPFVADFDFFFGDPGDEPFVGDFNNDGSDEIGIKRGSTLFLRYTLDTGVADKVIIFGDLPDDPMFGDWNGDGLETPGLYRPSTDTILLRNFQSSGIANMEIFTDGFESGDTSVWSTGR